MVGLHYAHLLYLPYLYGIRHILYILCILYITAPLCFIDIVHKINCRALSPVRCTPSTELFLSAFM